MQRQPADPRHWRSGVGRLQKQLPRAAVFVVSLATEMEWSIACSHSSDFSRLQQRKRIGYGLPLAEASHHLERLAPSVWAYSAPFPPSITVEPPPERDPEPTRDDENRGQGQEDDR